MVVMNQRGIQIFKMEMAAWEKKPVIKNIREIEIEFFVDTLTFVKLPHQNPLLLVTTYFGTANFINLSTCQSTSLDFSHSSQYYLNQPFLICKLSPDTFFFPSEQQNHQYVKIENNQCHLLKEMQNMGSLSQIKRGIRGQFEYILNKGRNQSRIYKIEDGVKVEVRLRIQIENSRVEEVWEIGEARMIVQTYEQEVFEIETKKNGQTTR